MSIVWITLLPWNSINIAAKRHDVDRFLLASIISVESSGNTTAVRFEPEFKWLLTPEKYARELKITKKTEEIMQKTSWGLGQVMGSVARELGHEGDLAELCNPEMGAHYTAKKIRSLMDKYEGIEDVVSSYNQGSPRSNPLGKYNNQGYVNKVMNKYNSLMDALDI